MENINRYYQKYYHYLRSAMHNSEYSKLFKLADSYAHSLIRNYFPSGKNYSILEIACGFGALVHSLKQRGYTDVLGIDISDEQIELARKFGVENIIQQEAIHFLETNNRKWDIIIALEFIEHLSKEEVMYFLSLCRQRINKGCRLILRTLNCISPFFGMYAFGDFTHQTFFTPSSLKQVVYRAGFTKVEAFPFRHDLRSVKGCLQEILSQMVVWIFKIVLACHSGGFRNLPIITPTFEVMATH